MFQLCKSAEDHSLPDTQKLYSNNYNSMFMLFSTKMTKYNERRHENKETLEFHSTNKLITCWKMVRAG